LTHRGKQPVHPISRPSLQNDRRNLVSRKRTSGADITFRSSKDCSADKTTKFKFFTYDDKGGERSFAAGTKDRTGLIEADIGSCASA
ncbi:hypothetical protein, partial [Maritalea sp.]|uniref:hypothetical protein n=1 Tax=Maritalea sp. TaxID=2003361 RepID=UPI003EF6BC94